MIWPHVPIFDTMWPRFCTPPRHCWEAHINQISYRLDEMWSLEWKTGCSIIWACDLVFDPTWPRFELVRDFMIINIVTKFHEHPAKMWPLECYRLKCWQTDGRTEGNHKRSTWAFGSGELKTSTVKFPCLKGLIYAPCIRRAIGLVQTIVPLASHAYSANFMDILLALLSWLI